MKKGWEEERGRGGKEREERDNWRDERTSAEGDAGKARRGFSDAFVRYGPHHDTTPPTGPTKAVLNKVKADLEAGPKESVTENEMAAADALLKQEMQVVKVGMGHKELTGAEYSSIWEECYREVVYVPSQSRYTRASLSRY
ncbi:Cell division cycle 5-related protein [Geodia barretti]|uniref:Cell division cycle 5-related protein n=1 Tax=Geodia barretti TaxID=519541 RepID=A0AA35RFD5_GEOBA|nr:Cell division cycle 5-related protein [Geodia barretti]